MHRRNTLFAILAVVLGFGMFGWWSFAIVSDQIPELQSEPVDVYLHLTAEFSTALALIIGGGGMLKARAWGRSVHLFSLGMLLYAVIQASGYYAQRSDFGYVVMFGIFAIYAAAGLVRALRGT